MDMHNHTRSPRDLAGDGVDMSDITATIVGFVLAASVIAYCVLIWIYLIIEMGLI